MVLGADMSYLFWETLRKFSSEPPADVLSYPTGKGMDYVTALDGHDLSLYPAEEEGMLGQTVVLLARNTAGVAFACEQLIISAPMSLCTWL